MKLSAQLIINTRTTPTFLFPQKLKNLIKKKENVFKFGILSLKRRNNSRKKMLLGSIYTMINLSI